MEEQTSPASTARFDDKQRGAGGILWLPRGSKCENAVFEMDLLNLDLFSASHAYGYPVLSLALWRLMVFSRTLSLYWSFEPGALHIIQLLGVHVRMKSKSS